MTKTEKTAMERKARYEGYAQEGLTAAEVAEREGLSYVTCYKWAKKLGVQLALNKGSEKRISDKEVVACIEEGLTCKQAAKKLGMCRSWLSERARRLGRTFARPAPANKGKRTIKPLAQASNRKVLERIPRGHGVNLKSGSRFLHLSGQALTDAPVYAWRGTLWQANNMITASSVEGLKPVMETAQ